MHSLPLPGLRKIIATSPADLRNDVVAGIVVTAFLVPVGMGYSQAAGLPPVYGLYATVLPLLAYAVFGPSRVLVLGPDSSLAPLIAATILPLAAGSPDRAVALASALAIGSGLIAVGVGLGKFGFVTELLSMPVRVGYLNGIAVVVILSQLPKLVGVDVGADRPLGKLIELVRAVGTLDKTTTIVGAASIAALILLRAALPRVPRSLVVVVLGIAAVSVFDLDHDLALVGRLPPGFPPPRSRSSDSTTSARLPQAP
ncbi:MAG: SulP family inorganic anion transporter [Acidimicrobiales bacterium]